MARPKGSLPQPIGEATGKQPPRNQQFKPKQSNLDCARDQPSPRTQAKFTDAELRLRDERVIADCVRRAKLTPAMVGTWVREYDDAAKRMEPLFEEYPSLERFAVHLQARASAMLQAVSS